MDLTRVVMESGTYYMKKTHTHIYIWQYLRWMMFVFLSSSMWVQGLLSPAGVFRDISFGLSCPFRCGSSVLLPFVSGLSLGFVFGLLFAIYLLQFFHIHRQQPPATYQSVPPASEPAGCRPSSRLSGYLHE